MKHEMIFSDIDGTLLDGNDRLTGRTVCAARALQRAGIPLVLCSARMPEAMKAIRAELGAAKLMVCYAGALIVEGDRILAAHYFSVEEVERLYSLIREWGAGVCAYRDNHWYVESVTPWIQEEIDIVQVRPEAIFFPEMFGKWKKEGYGPNKLLAVASGPEIDALRERLEKIEDPFFVMGRSKENYLEILIPGIHKGTGLLEVCRLKGIPPARVAAAGDGEVDIPMLRAAGLGIAMGNAPEEVKKAADLIAGSNREDGLAEVLEREILEKIG